MTGFSDSSLYQSVEAALALMNCDIDAAECHGILCGMLCGIEHFDPSAWLAHTTGYQEELTVDDLGSGHALAELLADTLAGFASEEFALEMLLPTDDSDLDVRVAALGGWCRGFLSGFGFAGITDVSDLSEDSQDFLRDLQQIGRIDPMEPADNGDEFALMEICEYARVGALLLHEETRYGVNPDDGSDRLH